MIEVFRPMEPATGGLQVSLSKDGGVVCNVAGSEVGQGPHGKRVPAGDPASHPGFGRQITEEGQSRQADFAELLDVTSPRDLFGHGAGHRDVLVETRERAVEPPGKIGNHTFRATGIATCSNNGGKLDVAQQKAAHESSRTTGLHDRRRDEVPLKR